LTSNGGYQRLLRAYGKKAGILRISPNVSTEKASIESVQKLKTDLGLTGKFVLGTFGMGVRGKAILWGALGQLHQKMDNLAFLAIGKMPSTEFQALQQTMPDLPVISTGFINSKEVAAYLQLLDLYLMLEPTHSPDHWNGSSTRSGTLATALQLGVPVLGTQGELNDLFIEQIQMPLIDELEENNIVEFVLKMAKEPSHYQALARKAIEQANQQLSWKNNVEKLLDLMKIGTPV
jgi:glycosyltransferase involved in cell wall biosynthesis